MSGSQLTAKSKVTSLKGSLLTFCLRPTHVLQKSIVLVMPKPWVFLQNCCCSCRPMFFMEMYCIFMQIGSPPSKNFQGFSIILNRCAERHLSWMCRVLHQWFNRRKRGGRNEKNLHKRSAGIRSVASNEPFFGTDTRWEPVINIFCWTRHINSPESVPHIYFGFHAESLIFHRIFLTMGAKIHTFY